jgi:hypothetical protein
MATLATPANMRAFEDAQAPNVPRTCFAYSPTTGERYSATPGDYLAQPDDEPLRDLNGDPMVLAREGATMVDAMTGELIA